MTWRHLPNAWVSLIDMAHAYLKGSLVTTIVAGRSPGQAAIVDFLSQIEGVAPVDNGGVKVWWGR